MRARASEPAKRPPGSAAELFDGSVQACLFDLDGVLTDTASVHAAAWKAVFDRLLAERGCRREFDPAADYDRFVDGKPRYDGVRDFLASRGISLPEGSRDAAPGLETVCSVGNLKEEHFLELLDRSGVHPYPGSERLLQEVVKAGLGTAVVSSSANTQKVVAAAGLTAWLQVRVDGLVIRERGLRGKPAPDSYLEAARQLGVDPSRAAIFEDALAGVEAGRAGGFQVVVGVARNNSAAALAAHGATVVVRDLADLLPR